jgi:hypothetical protein
MADVTEREVVAVVKTAGWGVGTDLLVFGHGSTCGDIRNGVSVALSTEKGGFVLDWESFEQAYLKLKAMRAQAESEYVDAIAVLRGRVST